MVSKRSHEVWEGLLASAKLNPLVGIFWYDGKLESSNLFRSHVLPLL